MTTGKEYLARIMDSFKANLYRGQRTNHQQPPHRLPESPTEKQDEFGKQVVEGMMQRDLEHYLGKPMTNDHHKMQSKSAAAQARIDHPLEIKVNMFRGPHPDPERKHPARPFLTIKGAALVSNYQDWLAMGRMWHEATNGSKYGFQAWCEWSEQGRLNDVAFAAEKWDSFGSTEAPKVVNINNVNVVSKETAAAVSKFISEELQQRAQTAAELLKKAGDIMGQRAKDYDSQGGERSMGTVAKMFNLATKREGAAAISESEAWLVMALLKMVRDRSTPDGHQDSCEDLVSYASLYGEARLAELREVEANRAKLRKTYQGECPVKFEDTPCNAPTRAQLVDVLKKVKEIYGTGAAKELIRLYGRAEKIMDVDAQYIPTIINQAFKVYQVKPQEDF